MKVKKLALTAGAIGALGMAGSFGTFAAFTATETHTPTVSSGTIKVLNKFELPSLANLGTRETTFTCNGGTGLAPTGTQSGGSECHAGADGKKAGYITVENTGTLPQDVYIDFDGPGVADATSPNVESSNVLASNIIVDSSFDENFATLGWAATRLFVMNRAAPAKYFTLQPDTEKTVYFRAWLRERAAGQYPLGDNEMQNKQITDQKVIVTAVEEGRANEIGPVFPAHDNGL
jgi:predicted ribosomally synthesized peptide with SipW-like signal peptide